MKRRIYGIVGYPAGHSLSPAMQNAAFGHLSLDAEYRLFEVPEGGLEAFFDGVGPGGEIAGLNVTIPHKIKAKEYLERKGSLDGTALKLGAVNTVKVCEGGSLKGFNTDGPGFYRSLVEDLKFEPEGRNIFVLGAGGAARAIVMYLGDGAGTISVFDVDRVKADELKSHYDRYYSAGKLHVASDAGEMERLIRQSDLVVNATPIGMKDSDPSPVPREFLRPGLYVYDLVYNRPMTRLLKDAAAARAHALNGIGMLLYQGTAAFEIWTGMPAPVAVMKRALTDAIKGRGNP